MPVYQNTFAAATPIGEALQGLTAAYFSGPSAIEKQKLRMDANYKSALTDQSRYEVMKDERDYGHRRDYANTFATAPQGQVVNPNTTLGRAILAGMDAADASGHYLNHVANSGGDDEAVMRARAGTGRALGVNEAISLGHQENVRGANAQNSLREATTVQNISNAGAMARLRATPLTESQVRAQHFQRLVDTNPQVAFQAVGPSADEVKGAFASELTNPEDQRRYVFGNGPTPQTVLDPRSPSGYSYFAPDNPIHERPAPAPSATNREDSGLKKTVQELKDETEQIDNSLSLIDEARRVGANEANYGAAGWARGTLQAAVQQGSAFASMFGAKGQQIMTELDALTDPNDPVSPAYFDENIPQREFMVNVLAYDLASTIAKQSGKSLSDRDFRAWKENVTAGGPLNSKADFMARMNIAERRLRAMRQQSTDRLSQYGEQFPGSTNQQAPAQTPQQTAQPPGGPVDLTKYSDEDLARLRRQAAGGQ